MKNKKREFKVSYKKAVGGEGLLTIIARNEKEALGNARNTCHTGSDFKINN